MEGVFILVEPAVPGNIGATARAIKVMGFNRLWLINPAPYLEGEAKWRAHGSYDILEKARVFNSLAEANQHLDLLIGTSAKKRRIKEDYISMEEIPPKLLLNSESVQKFGIVFGREESGLTNEEIQLCDWISYISMQTTYPSLNLSQAVMLYAYNLSRHTKIWEKIDRPESPQGYRNVKSNLNETLKIIGFKDNQPIFSRILERVSHLGDKDLNLLHSVLYKIQKHYKSW